MIEICLISVNNYKLLIFISLKKFIYVEFLIEYIAYFISLLININKNLTIQIRS